MCSIYIEILHKLRSSSSDVSRVTRLAHTGFLHESRSFSGDTYRVMHLAYTEFVYKLKIFSSDVTRTTCSICTELLYKPKSPPGDIHPNPTTELNKQTRSFTKITKMSGQSVFHLVSIDVSRILLTYVELPMMSQAALLFEREEPLWALMLQKLLGATFNTKSVPTYRSYYEQWKFYEKSKIERNEIYDYTNGRVIACLILDLGIQTSSWVRRYLEYLPLYWNYIYPRIFRGVAIKIIARHGSPYGFVIFLNSLKEAEIPLSEFKDHLVVALGETELPQIIEVALQAYPEITDHVYKYLTTQRSYYAKEKALVLDYLLRVLPPHGLRERFLSSIDLNSASKEIIEVLNRNI